MLLVGSANAKKLGEIAAILDGIPVEIVGSGMLPSGQEIAETGETFSENVQIKAREYARRAAALPSGPIPRWIIADDSGLCVDRLGGAPGVFSARYAGVHASDSDNIDKLLEALAGVPEAERQAHFVCVIACARVPKDPSGSPQILFEVEGTCEGTIAESPRGKGGFGYDPVFVERTTGNTFGEIAPAEKNRLSHRGDALRKFRNRFVELLENEPGTR